MFANRNTLDNAEIVNIRSYGGDPYGNLPIVKININGNMWHLLYDTGSQVSIIDSEKCKVLKENWDDALKTLRIVSVTGQEQTLTRVKTCRVGNENGIELGEIRFWLMSLGDKAYDGILGINDIRRFNIPLPAIRERCNMISLKPEDRDYVDLSYVASVHRPMVSSSFEEKSVKRIENEAVKLPPTEFNRNCIMSIQFKGGLRTLISVILSKCSTVKKEFTEFKIVEKIYTPDEAFSEVKLQILREIEVEKKKKTDVAQKHNIPQSSLSTIIKNSEKIHQQALHAGESSRKRARGSTYADVDEALLQWFKQARSAALPVNSPLLSEKAKTLALEFGLKDFTGSGGWIERWKARHGIKLRNICGESADVNRETMTNWLTDVMPNIISNYACKDIFNADETGLFWRLLPDKTLHFKGETCTGRKASKERITILLCCNMDGSEKMQPLVIGKAKQPRCFRGIKHLPVQYEANQKAWMTGLLFESWVRHIDKKMAGQHRQIILLLDNCGAHPPDMQGLTNTRIAFLPPNTTSMLQPCDQGIIRNFKMIYRTRLMRKYLTAYDAGTALTINLKQAVDIISVAWNDVLPATISNCWHHSGIIKSDVSSPLDTPQPATQMWEQQSLFDRMKEVLKIPLEMDFDSYADADNDVVTNAMLSDVEIVESILQAKEEEETDQVDEETKQDDLRPNVTKQDDLRPNLTKQNDLRPNVTKQDDLRPNVTKQDDLRPNVIKQDDLRPNVTKQNDLRPKVTKQDDLRPNVTKQNDLRPNVTKQDDLRPNVTKQNDLRPNVTKQDDLRPNVTKQDDLRPNVTKQDDLRPNVTNQNDLRPNVTKQNDLRPKVTKQDDLRPNVTKQDDLRPNVTKQNDLRPNVTKQDDLRSNVTKQDDLRPKVTKQDDLAPNVTKQNDLRPNVTKQDDLRPNVTKEDDLRPNVTKQDDLRPNMTKQNDFRPNVTKQDDLRPNVTKQDDLRPNVTKQDDLRPNNDLRPYVTKQNDFRPNVTKQDDLRPNVTKQDDFRPNVTKQDDFRPNVTKQDDLRLNVRPNRLISGPLWDKTEKLQAHCETKQNDFRHNSLRREIWIIWIKLEINLTLLESGVIEESSNGKIGLQTKRKALVPEEARDFRIKKTI
ncbi:TIGD4 [Cordylochernes scorpioides]|uniref:TIGD4 n=1 Tax=Cordylochernes scorpioides TaxID=51811 RepID=A0ABY6KDV5_9ARAC|nr:TIGD4 [Cordylochernes scorpioides]